MKKLLVLLMLLLILPLYGCWNYSEIHDALTVSGIAIDKGEEKNYLLTIETVKYSADKESAPEPVYYEIEQDTVFKALRESIAFTGRKLYLGHMLALIISDEIAKKGIMNIIDFFIRDHEPRFTVPVFVTKEDKAKDVLTKKALQSIQTAREINDTIESTKDYSGIGDEKRMYKIYNEIFEVGISTVIPVLKVLQVTEEKETFELHGLGCFKDDKLIGYIDPLQVPYFAGLIDCYDGGVLEIEIPDAGFITIEIIDSKTKYKVKYKNEQFHIYIDIDIHFNIGSDLTNENFKLDEFTPKELETIINRHRNFYSEEFLKFVREELKCDVIGIERLIRHKDYKHWKANKGEYDFLQDSIIHINTKSEYATAGNLKLREVDKDE